MRQPILYRKERPWRRYLAHTARGAVVSDTRVEPREFDVRVQRFDDPESLASRRLWVDAPLTEQAREHLGARTVTKAWDVRLADQQRRCGLLVRYHGDGVYWPYPADYRMPLTYGEWPKTAGWWCTLLVLADGQVDMVRGEMSFGLMILADMLANPRKPLVVPEDDAAFLREVANEV